MPEAHPHQNQPVYTHGVPLSAAHVAVILLHGRGGSAQDMLGLAARLPQERIAYLAPQAANHTWYPNSGFGPIASNEPYVSSALQTVADLLARVEADGIPADRIVLGGFSQGACVTSEFVARHPRRYGALLVLSGALLGPPDLPRRYSGALDGTPVFVAGGDQDAWVTEAQLRLTGRLLGELGGEVRVEIQSDTAHTVRQSELLVVRDLLLGLAGQTA